MDLTFIGHQSWMASSENTNILIDPVLMTNFGHSENINFEVYPPRVIHTANMPLIDAVLLSHEHLDHFHLPSLNVLPKDIQIIISSNMPQCVQDALLLLGFTNVARYDFYTDIWINDIRVKLYPAGNGTVFWEQRVTQFLLESKNCSCFVAVDALISESYCQDIENHRESQPNSIIVANNSQLAPKGAIGAYSNLLPIASGKLHDLFPGVALLNSILIEYLTNFQEIKNIIICGNGFLNRSELFGPFLFSDNKRLAKIAEELSNGDVKVFGPYPGECIQLSNQETSTCNWITYNELLHQSLINKTVQFKMLHSVDNFLPITTTDNKTLSSKIKQLESELAYLSSHLIRSPACITMVKVTNYIADQQLDANKIIFRFYHQTDIYSYVFNLNAAKFIQIKHEEEMIEILEKYPLGIEFYLDDFLAMLDGKLQIWDLAGNAIRTWYITGIYECLVPFLFEVYGEQCNPRLASLVYLNNIELTH